jgi:ABC-type uncharacterized transport system auxiliary subunit
MTLKHRLATAADGLLEVPTLLFASRRRLLATLAALPAVMLPACVPFGGNGAPQFAFFVLEDLKAADAPAGASAKSDQVLLIATGQSQALYDSDRMVFSPDGVSRAFFQYSNWSERPARRLVTLIERRLYGSGAFESVALTTAGVRGDLVLSIRLDEMLLDDSRRPAVARVVVMGELVDWRTRSIVDRRTFAHEVQAPTADARGAARATSVAVTEMLDQMTEWTRAASAGPAPPARPAAPSRPATPSRPVRPD